MNANNQPGTQNQNGNGARFLAPTVHQPADDTMTTDSYFAQPYNTSATGFYFSDYEDFQAKAEALRDPFGAPVEEFELQAIDLDNAQSELFNALKIDQSTLERWFDDVVDLDERDMAGVFFLVSNNGYDLDAALSKKDDITLYEGSLLDAATDLFDEIYLNDVPQAVRGYIDYRSFATDCQCNGDFVEFALGGTTFTCTSANHC